MACNAIFAAAVAVKLNIVHADTYSLFLLPCRLAKARELSERVSHPPRLVTKSDSSLTRWVMTNAYSR